MTTGEQGEFLLLMHGTFAGDLDRAASEALLRYCGHWRLEDAAAAIERLVVEGHTFVPKPGDLVKALERARGGRGSFSARAALSGLTVAELEAQCRDATREAVERRRTREEAVNRWELGEAMSGRVRADR